MAKYLKDWNTGEYISRDDALIAMQYCCEECDNYNGAMCRACSNADEMDIICDIPAAEVQPVKRGEWINPESVAYGITYCSECKNEAYWDTDYGQQLFDFCPYCGADMRGGDSNA